MSRILHLAFGYCLLVFATLGFAADKTYQFILPSKVQITIVEAPFEKRPTSACPNFQVKLKTSDVRPTTYVKSIRAHFQGYSMNFDVTCMTDAWNGRPLQHAGVIRYFGGWCKVYKGKPSCAFRGVFADGSESFAAEWYGRDTFAKRTVFSSSPDVIDLFMKNIDPPKYE